MINRFKIFFCLLLGFTMCGCWNYSELNTLAIATTLGIDKKDNEYLVSLMIANARSAQVSSKEGQSQTVVLEGKGETITEALEEIDLKSPKQIYLNHISSIILSEEIAKEGVSRISDLLIRAPESRKKFYLLIAKDTSASDVLKILTPLEGLTSQNISSMIEGTTNYQGIANVAKYSNFINAVMERGDQPTISTIKIEGKKNEGDSFKNLEQSKPEALLKLGPLAVFKDDKLIGFTTEEESEGINILNNRIQNMSVKIKCDNSFIVGHIDKLLPSYKIYLKNNIPSVDIDIIGGGSINEINCKRDLTKPEIIEEIRKDLEKEVKNISYKGIDAAQKHYKSDILKIGLRFYHKYPKYFLKEEKDWDTTTFSNMKINVKVNLDIKTKGSLEQTIREEET